MQHKVVRRELEEELIEASRRNEEAEHAKSKLKSEVDHLNAQQEWNT